MATPESKVKRDIVKLLTEHKVYFFPPATGGYGRSGVPDIVGCWKGRFIGVECKAKGNKATALQQKNLEDIAKAGGTAIIVDETGVGALRMMMDTWERHGVMSGVVWDLLDPE